MLRGQLVLLRDGATARYARIVRAWFRRSETRDLMPSRLTVTSSCGVEEMHPLAHVSGAVYRSQRTGERLTLVGRSALGELHAPTLGQPRPRTQGAP